MEDASAYIQFILGSIQSRDLFHSIRIEPTAAWEYLLWMDQVHTYIAYVVYGMVVCTLIPPSNTYTVHMYMRSYIHTYMYTHTYVHTYIHIHSYISSTCP